MTIPDDSQHVAVEESIDSCIDCLAIIIGMVLIIVIGLVLCLGTDFDLASTHSPGSGFVNFIQEMFFNKTSQ